MANETLTGSTTVIDKDIPQTIQELSVGISNVIDKDIPQTIQELSLSVTNVVGQVNDKVLTGIVSTGIVIGKPLNKIFNNFGVIKLAIPNSQILV